MVKKIITFILLVVCIGIANAQLDKLRDAFIYTQAGKLDSAQQLIDAVCKHPETSTNAQAWYVKAFVYKELFKKHRPVNVANASEAFESSKKAILLDTSAENKASYYSIIKSLTATVNNTFGEMLDTVNYKKSAACVELQKSLLTFLKPKANADSVEVYYYSIMGSYFQTVYEKNPKKNMKFLKLAEESYNKVLIRDPNNISSNYNMGIIYYNQAVGLIMNKLDYDFDIATLNDIQDEAVMWFKKSLPYMEKAYQLNPRRKETLIGLSGIYYSLHENEKSQQFQKLSEDLDKQK